MTDVFVLTRWSNCADHIDHGPSVFASFEAARASVNDEWSPDWWFQKAPGRALRWRDPKNHNAGFWEILTLPVQGSDA